VELTVYANLGEPNRQPEGGLGGQKEASGRERRQDGLSRADRVVWAQNPAGMTGYALPKPSRFSA
jgi:hypothetical protein